MNDPTAEKLLFAAPPTADEVCKVLEETILKYFPPQLENVDSFIFAISDYAVREKTSG